MCQEWIDRGRLVCLPSSSPLRAISNISDEREIACSISRPHWIPFATLSLLLSLCLSLPCMFTIQKVLDAPAGWCAIVCPFPPQWAHLRWDFELLWAMLVSVQHPSLFSSLLSFILHLLIAFSAQNLLLTGLIMYRLEFSNKVESFRNRWNERNTIRGLFSWTVTVCQRLKTLITSCS